MPRVLIVDDDAATAGRLAARVQALGYEASVVNSARMAVQAMQTSEVAVMLTTLRLQGRHGVELIRLAREISPGTRAVLLAAEASARDYRAALDQGAVEVLIDPGSDAALDQAIRKAVACDHGFHGSLHGLSLVDLLRVMHQARLSLVLRVGPCDGAIHLRDGEIVHAVAVARGGGLGSLRPLLHGRAALITMLGSRNGALLTDALPEDAPCTVREPFEPLLLGVLRQLDEQRRAPQGAAAPDPFGRDAPAAPLPPHLRPVRPRRRALWPLVVGAFAITVVLGALGLLLILGPGARVRASAHARPTAAAHRAADSRRAADARPARLPGADRRPWAPLPVAQPLDP